MSTFALMPLYSDAATAGDAAGVPFFSICIPAYHNAAHLSRLLQSVFSQSFQDYEVIVSDDTPDDSLLHLLQSTFADQPIRYYHNTPALGTPANWNAAIEKAKGSWIKLMHHDDWLAHPQALQQFYDAVQARPGVQFFFAAYVNISEPDGAQELVQMRRWEQHFFRYSPLHLFKKVYVGNPSCTLVKAGIPLQYNPLLKFVVDFDYYIRLIQAGMAYHYIDAPLLHIGFHARQVTQYTKYNPAVQVFENVLLLRQLGEGILRNVFVYDYYWRLFRNIGVRTAAEAAQYLQEAVPTPLVRLLGWQAMIPRKLLRVGVVSKACMLVAYLRQLVLG